MDTIRLLETKYLKPALPQVQSGDTVRVHQLIKEGAKQRIQVFEGVIIRRHRMNEVGACITVRRIASGVGVEKTFLLHSPNVSKIEIMRRAKIRRNFLSFLRERRGKSARLREVSFDKLAANDVSIVAANEDPDVFATELDVDQNEDALDDAVSLNETIKSENREAAAGDEVAPSADIDNSSEQEAAAEEFAEGVDQADRKSA